MMSAGSGYQADSDSNSDVPLDPQAAPISLATPSSPTRTDKSAGAFRTSGADEPSESEGRVAETGAESKEKPTSMLGRIGDSAWRAVEAITGHTTEPSGEDSKASAQTADAEGLHAESLPAAGQKAGASQPGSLSEPAAVKEAELSHADSGYEAGEEGPVQAAPEGLSQAAPDRSPSGLESEHSMSGFRASPPAIKTGTESQQDPSAVGMGQAQDADSYAKSAAESGGMAGSQPSYPAPTSGASQEPLHVHTDPASSKRGISGLGSEQPGSASKRARGDSTVAKLINTFDSPMSGRISSVRPFYITRMICLYRNL